MREPYTQLYLHLVWATWDRLPLITSTVQEAVYTSIKDKCVEMKAEAIAIGGIEDHVHLLVRFPTTISVSQLVKHVKGASSHLVTHRLQPESGFKWQEGYGAFTLTKALAPRVRNYIKNQAEHHENQTLHKNLERCNRTDGSDAMLA